MLNRKTSVTYFVGRGQELPMIRLRGRWLAAAGFARGVRIAVAVTQGRITLELAAAPADVAEQEVAPYALPESGG
jgi:hypothetical protein